MRTRTTPTRMRALCVAAAAACCAPAHAITVLWWDGNGAAAGSGGSGQWDTGSFLWATAAGGIGPGVPALRWPGADAVASFGGSAGIVTVKAHLAAAELNFLVGGYTLADGGGYQLTLGSAGTDGVLRVAAGGAATVRVALVNGNAGGAVELRGGGTLALDGESLAPDRLRIAEGTLRLARPDAAAASTLTLAHASAQLDLGSGGSVDVGALGGVHGSQLQLGGRTLRLTGVGAPPATVSALAFSGGSSSQLVLGTQRRLTTTWAQAAQASTMGQLTLHDAALTLDGHALDLLGSTTSLLVRDGSTLTLVGGAALTGAGTLQIGSSAGGSSAVVTLGAGSSLRAPLLALPGSHSLLEVGAQAQATIAEFAPGAAGRVLLRGGTLTVGDPALANSRLGPDRSSSFAGLVSGTSGVLRKVGPGTLTLSNDSNDFSGRVQVDAGTLAVSNAALRAATLTLASGAVLDVTPTASGVFGIGALDGSFDLGVPAGALLVLGAPAQDAVWSGRFAAGNVSLHKVDRNVQTLAGAGSTGSFAAPRLSAGGGTLRLDGGRYVLAGRDDTPYTLNAGGAGTRLEVLGGAQVTLAKWVGVSAGAVLSVSGAGTRLDAPAGQTLPVQVGGPGGAGTLVASQRAHLQLGNLLLEFDQPGAPPRALVDSGATMTVTRALQFESDAAELTIDGGSADVVNLFVRRPDTFAGRVLLSDAADGTPALTLRRGDATPANGTLYGFNGRFVDAGSGAGSIRKVDAATSFALLQPLGITGRVIVDGGQVRLGSAGDLASVTLHANVAMPLDLSALEPGAPLALGALAGNAPLALDRGLDLGDALPRQAAYGGALTLAGDLRKIGAGTQTLGGGASFAQLSVLGGALVLDGGTWQGSGALGVVRPAADTGAAAASLALRNRGVLRIAEHAVFQAPAAPSGARAATVSVGGAGSRLEIAGNLALYGGTLRVEAGAALSAGTAGAVGSDIVVDRATLRSGALVNDGASRVWLTDPDAGRAPPTAATQTALTLWSVRDWDALAEVPFRAHVLDGTQGAGGITFGGSHVRWLIDGTLANTGPLIARGVGVTAVLNTTPAARRLLATDGAALAFGGRDHDMSRSTIEVAGGGRANYAGLGTLRGATLEGVGHGVSGGGYSFEHATLGVNAQLQAFSPVTWRSGTLRGELVGFDAGTLLDQAVISTSGRLRLYASATLRNSENNGQIDLFSATTLTLDGALASGAGSRILVNAGTRIDGSPLLLNGGLLVNNGTLASPLAIRYLGKAKGSGSFGIVTVGDGGTFAPGNSPGRVVSGDAVLGRGGRFEVEVADALGGPGIGHDLWQIDGVASFLAGTTPNSAFTLQLVSLDSAGAPGAAARFDATRGYRWTVLTAAVVHDWQPGEVLLDSSRFVGADDGRGRFALEWSGQSLDVVYAPVPEPAALWLALAGLLVLLGARRVPRPD